MKFQRYVRWAPVEDAKLKALARTGASIDAIALAMGRSKGAIKNRLSKLRATTQIALRPRGRSKNSSLPTMPQRDVLQKLLNGGWTPSIVLQPASENVLLKMVDRGWLEHRKDGSGCAFRLTDAGRKVFHAPLL